MGEDKPSTAWMRDKEARKPMGHSSCAPGPGMYKLKGSVTGDGSLGRTLGVPLPRPIESLPGPGVYEPQDHMTYNSPPEWATCHRTSIRKPPWDEPEREKEFKLMSGEKLHVTNVKNEFTAQGPK